jgi:hypothetical protein
VRHFETEPLTGQVIQSALNHTQLFIGHGFHAGFFGDVLTQQAIEIFVAAALPAVLRIGKESLNAQGLVDTLMVRKLLAVVCFLKK